MPFIFKEKNQMVQDIIDRLKLLLPENTDFSVGTPLRNILESMMEELDIQYWQLEQVYKSGHIDDAVDEDLDKLVALLGVKRNPAVASSGSATFFRTTPADADYIIPAGTIISTLPDTDGNIIQFQTKADATLLTNATEVIVNIICIATGIIGNIPAFTIKVINNPPIGIEDIKNIVALGGGKDIETNADLRERTKHILDTEGNATIDALYYIIKLTVGVKEVTVVDMARGIGTVDILVLTDTVPMTNTKKNELNALIAQTKAGGIDVQLVEPTVISTNISAHLTLTSGYVVGDVLNGVQNAIINYVNQLDIGQTLIVNQLSKVILNSSSAITDITITVPSNNVVVNTTEIIRTGTITIT